MNPESNYRILRLVASNIMRLKAADVTPGRNAVIVAGDNAQGKSSLLTSIAMALGGKKQFPDKPVTIGEEAGEIVIVLGDSPNDPERLLVRRVIQADGKTVLEITAPGNFKAPSPQSILDSLCNSIAFDPMAFVQMDDAKQLATLRELVGLDFTAVDQQRKALYAERTVVNREVESKRSQADSISIPPDTPEVEVSLADLVAEQRRRQEFNQRNQTERNRLPALEREVQVASHSVQGCRERIADIERELASARDRLATVENNLTHQTAIRDAQQKTVAVLEDKDVAAVQQQIVDAQEVNANVAARHRKEALEKDVVIAEGQAKLKTEKIEEIDKQKADAIANAQWPVEGLGFGEHGVTYKGVPFSQASGAEQVEVSFAMAAALHPKLKVALLRNCSLLDKKQMAVLHALIEKHDMQAWLEVVSGDAGPCGIIIEDGEAHQESVPENVVKVDVPPTKTRRKRATKEPVAEQVTEEPPY